MGEANGIGNISDDQRYVARAAASADQLAARFGTPTWSRLIELAGPLARDFRIADVTGLAAVLSEALAKVNLQPV
jgi:hypothetical protein